MAGDNNNKNASARPDDGPTSELEALTDSVLKEAQAESDANTCPLGDEEADSDDVEGLRRRLKRERERVESLLYENEQLALRLTGAEKEISARDELGSILRKDLKDAHKVLAARDRELQRSRREIESLEARVARALDGVDLPILQADSSTGTRADIDSPAPRETGAEPTAADAAPVDIGALRVQLDDLRSYIEGRRSDWEALQAGIEARDAALAAATAEAETLRVAAAAAQDRLTAAEALGAQLRQELADVRGELREQVARRRRAEAEIRDFVTRERTAKDATIAEQAGQLATARQDVASLGQRLRQSELHADDMRRVIDQLREDIQPSHTRASALQTALSGEQERAASLASRLDAATLEIESLSRENVRLKDEFERETRQIRLELDAAQDTIAGHETMSEQLASDLIDNRSFREALEQQLAATEAGYSERVKKLERRMRSLEQELEDRDRKIEKKDAAISALLAELSNRVASGASLNELDQAIGEMDDQIASVEESRESGDKDRPSRVLIGTVGGQELRFPLFRNRLTVGRTAQNDIQLPAAFISRRHAVILTDRDGTRIVDWGSKNGVYVNGARISEQPLHNGDRVRIGTAEFLFEERQRR